MDGSTGAFEIVNPSTGEVVVAVTCERAAEAIVIGNPSTGKPIHARTLKRAVAAGVLPGWKVAGRWVIERDAVETVAAAGWESLGIKRGPVPKDKQNPAKGFLASRAE